MLLADTNEEYLTTIADRLGDSAVHMVCDVSQEDEVRSAIEATVDRFGRLDALATSAGVNIEADRVSIDECEIGAFQQVVNINLNGTFLAVKHALPHLLESKGSVVTVSSTAGSRGHGQGYGYPASKGGVVALTRLLANQYGAQGIRVNCVCPGATASEGMGSLFKEAAGAEMVSPLIPLGKPGTPEEVASLVVHLLSSDAAYVTGQIIAADGGATTR